ncbi:phosphate/phosphite/phosphonate ABC transporter substrate-binding protein [Staphylococcus hominis]|uniref:phosphate/phosphite/phosphonate ABC transporter substrate-binding protein n=1 Tax=Staphylococcus hominis TaxID=1290 RepID=UPI00119FC3BB|nr:phosphate/phosphite/phosphonate ABC transporter substrate-binding protein [Staphylococcus hominis]MDU3976656.1 phosphate/phosphite/phosphonate ABC transporter substrate-binding protein [Staphylococcus sp.]MBC2909475.1 phosphate/phosphite/phosphonate ABC transporter substrate-binding protein [Staphylococcus hominis]MBC2911811.1 phosphate/phosphite/phosphonate ABC transporter substrate-binding protein [Staphylococcus hominis]MBC2913790.1 phosphate/phosphite/phosphonate ABC transporter substrat
MKRLKFLVIYLVITIIVSGCSNIDNVKHPKEVYTPKSLTVGFIPSQNAQILNAKVKPLQQLLSDELEVPVKVHIATNYNTMIEGLKSKKIDIAFISPVSYTLAHDAHAADVLLKSKGYLVDNKGNQTHHLVDYYRSQIVVRKDSNINHLKDLKDKKIALQDVESTSGYIYPLASLMEKGIKKSDIQIQQVKGHDQGLIALLNHDVEAVATYQDARADLKKEVPDIYQETKVIYRTKKIPNDTISVRNDMSNKWKKKISQAFIEISHTKKGKQIISDIYGHQGYEKAKDSDFDTVRKYRDFVD